MHVERGRHTQAALKRVEGREGMGMRKERGGGGGEGEGRRGRKEEKEEGEGKREKSWGIRGEDGEKCFHCKDFISATISAMQLSIR